MRSVAGTVVDEAEAKPEENAIPDMDSALLALVGVDSTVGLQVPKVGILVVACKLAREHASKARFDQKLCGLLAARVWKLIMRSVPSLVAICYVPTDLKPLHQSLVAVLRLLARAFHPGWLGHVLPPSPLPSSGATTLSVREGEYRHCEERVREELHLLVLDTKNEADSSPQAHARAIQLYENAAAESMGCSEWMGAHLLSVLRDMAAISTLAGGKMAVPPHVLEQLSIDLMVTPAELIEVSTSSCKYAYVKLLNFVNERTEVNLSSFPPRLALCLGAATS